VEDVEHPSGQVGGVQRNEAGRQEDKIADERVSAFLAAETAALYFTARTAVFSRVANIRINGVGPGLGIAQNSLFRNTGRSL
jgi:hypothetical protein